MNRKIINPSRKKYDKGRPDYYITPSHDFTQYTRDCEEKYWSKDTAFDWGQSVKENLRENLMQMGQERFHKVAIMVLPMIRDKLLYHLENVRHHTLPMNQDALRDIDECLPDDMQSVAEALVILSPFESMGKSVRKLKDQLEIAQREKAEIEELQRLGLYRKGTMVKKAEWQTETEEQSLEIGRLSLVIGKLQAELKIVSDRTNGAYQEQEMMIRKALDAVTPNIVSHLSDTYVFVEKIVQTRQLPEGSLELSRVRTLILKRQMRGLKDIANHALVVEQSAIAPLTMGIIHYRRHREIQEAMTTFIRDEAKHSATFRRFLVEKLEAKEYISSILIKGADRYMWLARFFPATGMFLAVIVEIIGAAYLEFFATEEYMPDKLFCGICKTISTQDEKRHIDLCVAMYNELFRKAGKWERIRNSFALKMIMRSVYGDKDEDHHLIQAFLAFGVESSALYSHIVRNLCSKLARVGMYIEEEKLIHYILGNKATNIRLDK